MLKANKKKIDENRMKMNRSPIPCQAMLDVMNSTVNITYKTLLSNTVDVIGNPREVATAEVIDIIIKEVKKDPQLDYIDLTSELNSIHESLIPVTTVPVYKEKIKELVTPPILIKLDRVLYNQNSSCIKSIVEYLSGIFLLSVIKTGNVTSSHIEKRLKNFLTTDKLPIPEFTPEEFQQLYDIIKAQIDRGDLDPNDLIS
ncbi:unnamed protein product [Parnassius apollo]|uniref:(apollo) hypothetical protein n=1 Tax=Parnassius apollo TaxID=110799 RepID=A0A8S3YC04_PARAO|nr:unnamed protein product [Parnassius apollo]